MQDLKMGRTAKGEEIRGIRTWRGACYLRDCVLERGHEATEGGRGTSRRRRRAATSLEERRLAASGGVVGGRRCCSLARRPGLEQSRAAGSGSGRGPLAFALC
jgi:hypothetical protein